MPAETSQTLDRGLRVLEKLADRPSGLSITELARELGVARTIVYRLVVTLEQHGFVQRTHDGRCRLGSASLIMAHQVQPMVRDSALPILRKLADRANATAYLTMVDGSDAVIVAAAEPARSDVHLTFREGARSPVDEAVAGRAAVAARTSTRALEPGWVIRGGDPAHGGYAIAAPLLGVTGLEAAVGLVSLTELDPTSVGPSLVTATSTIARSLTSAGAAA